MKEKDDRYYAALGRYNEAREEYEELLRKRNNHACKLADICKNAVNFSMYSGINLNKAEVLFNSLKHAEITLENCVIGLNNSAEICGKQKVVRNCYNT